MSLTSQIVNPETDDPPQAYFRFEGVDGNDTVDISIPRAALKTFPDSVLAKLADDAWKSQDRRTQGEKFENPFVTKPLEGCCKDHWSNDLAHLISDLYLWKFQGKDPFLPAGVDIKDALVVLDYYGLAVDDLSIISLDNLSNEDQIISKLFLQEIPLMEQAKDYVVNYLKDHPARETLFCFVGKTDNMHAINHNRACHFKRIHGPSEFVRVGSLKDYHKHFGWAQDVNQRQIFLNQLQGELPSLQIKYLTLDFTADARFELGSPPQEFCWIEQENEDGEGYFLQRVVLSVRIPAQESRKRPRVT